MVAQERLAVNLQANSKMTTDTFDQKPDFDSMDDEAVRIGRELSGIVMTDAWRAFVRLVEKRKLEVGEYALNDSEAPKPKGNDYWRGFRDGATQLENLVRGLTQAARALEGEDKVERSTVMNFGLGTGPAVGDDF